MAVEIVATGDTLASWALVVDGETVDHERMIWGHNEYLGTCWATVYFGDGRTVYYEDVAVRPDLPVLDVSDSAAPVLDGRPLEPGTTVTIRRGRAHPDDPPGPAEVDIGGVPAHGIRVVRNGRVVVTVP